MKSFDEWLDTTKLRVYMDENSLEAAWEAGQQSKQAEVDELQKNLNKALKTIEIQQRFLDDADGANKILTIQASELQKRIDEVIEYIGTDFDDFYTGVMVESIHEILKGDQS